jgi:outer membrane protein
MFKRVIFTAALILSSVSSVFAADMKIGIFDERLVLSKAPQLELIEAKLQKQFADRLDEMKSLKEKGLAKQDQGKRDAVTMTEAQRIQLDRELAEISTSYQSKNKNLQEDFQRAKQDELTKIRVKIQQIVSKVATDENFDLVLRIESVAFRKEAIDISNQVITVLSNPAG